MCVSEELQRFSVSHLKSTTLYTSCVMSLDWIKDKKSVVACTVLTGTLLEYCRTHELVEPISIEVWPVHWYGVLQKRRKDKTSWEEKRQLERREEQREKKTKHSFRPQSDNQTQQICISDPHVLRIIFSSKAQTSLCCYSQIHEPREWDYPAGHYAIQMVSGFNNLPSQPGDRLLPSSITVTTTRHHAFLYFKHIQKCV